MKKTIGLFSAMVSLVMILSIAPSVYAFTTVSGDWVITQAAGQSQGVAPKVIACGTFSLAVTGASNPAASRGAFSGTISFATLHSIPGSPVPVIPSSEQVSGTWMKGATGALFVSFSGTSPVPLIGSFSSPSPQPAPSGSVADGCNAVPSSLGLAGFVHLPRQGTEGLFIYSAETVSTFP